MVVKEVESDAGPVEEAGLGGTEVGGTLNRREEVERGEGSDGGGQQVQPAGQRQPLSYQECDQKSKLC